MPKNSYAFAVEFTVTEQTPDQCFVALSEWAQSRTFALNTRYRQLEAYPEETISEKEKRAVREQGLQPLIDFLEHEDNGEIRYHVLQTGGFVMVVSIDVRPTAGRDLRVTASNIDGELYQIEDRIDGRDPALVAENVTKYDVVGIARAIKRFA